MFLVGPVSWAHAEPYDDIYVLGDSLSDQGNLFQATFTETGLGIPRDDFYFMGRFADGEIYAGLLAEKLGVSLTRSLAGGNNFAFGGTRTNYNIVEDPPTPGGFPPGLYPWTLNLQREAFETRVDVVGGNPNALHIVWSGSNDVADLIRGLALGQISDPAPAIEEIVEGIDRVIEAYVNAGARDILVPNVPNLGVVPGITVFGPEFSALATQISSLYNARLSVSLGAWEDTGIVNIIHYDVFSTLTAVVADPGAFGFTNASEPCYTGFVDPTEPPGTVCGNPEGYVFWDYEHPTTAAHAFFAVEMHAAIVSDLLRELRDQVDRIEVHQGIRNSLQAKLDAAQKALARGKRKTASNVLRAFSAQVEALSGKKLSEEDADDLRHAARRIVSLLQ
jgi:phospholipase/lecithinase/hemolysin